MRSNAKSKETVTKKWSEITSSGRERTTETFSTWMSCTRMSCCKQNWGSIQNDWWFWNHPARNACESMFFNDMVDNGFGTSVTDKAVIIRCCAMGYLVGKQKTTRLTTDCETQPGWHVHCKCWNDNACCKSKGCYKVLGHFRWKTLPMSCRRLPICGDNKNASVSERPDRSDRPSGLAVWSPDVLCQLVYQCSALSPTFSDLVHIFRSVVLPNTLLTALCARWSH